MAARRAASIENANGGMPLLLICDHASAHLPEAFGDLGLPAAVLQGHAAWDPGAMKLARHMALLLDAPLVNATASRLIVDTNRAPDAADLIVSAADGIPIAANQSLSDVERCARLAAFHTPFHNAIAGLLDSRPNMRAVVSVHSFEPMLFGGARPWHIGLLHGGDERLAGLVRSKLGGEGDLVVGDNEPYSPADGVFYTLDRHGTRRGLATLMIEVRNDLLRSDIGVEAWAKRLVAALAAAVTQLSHASR